MKSIVLCAFEADHTIQVVQWFVLDFQLGIMYGMIKHTLSNILSQWNVIKFPMSRVTRVINPPLTVPAIAGHVMYFLLFLF